MLTLDVAITLPQQEVVMLAQAGQIVGATGGMQTYAASFKTLCQDVVRIRQGQEALADQLGLYDPSRQIAFLGHVLDNLGYRSVSGRYINLTKDIEATIKTGVLELPKHGKLTALEGEQKHMYDYKLIILAVTG